MADQRRLLVPGRAGDGQGAAEQGRIAVAADLGAADDPGQGDFRNPEQFAQVVAPHPGL